MKKKRMLTLKSLLAGSVMIGTAISTPSAIAQNAPQPAMASTPPSISECIQTGQINEWHVANAQTAIVRNGPKRYLVKLGATCPNLGMGGGGLMFRTDGQNRDLGGARICGGVGEYAYSRNQPPCPIQSVSKIQKDQFDQLRDASKKYQGG